METAAGGTAGGGTFEVEDGAAEFRNPLSTPRQQLSGDDRSVAFEVRTTDVDTTGSPSSPAGGEGALSDLVPGLLVKV